MADRDQLLLKLLKVEGRRLHTMLTRLTLREDAAEDLLQELFLKLQAAEGFFRATDPVAYAYRTAIRMAYNWRRKQKRLREMEIFPEQLETELLPLDDLVRAEEIEQLLTAISRLSDLHRQAVVTRYIQQESYDVVGQRIGRNAHQARMICHRAVKRLRRIMARSARSSNSTQSPNMETQDV